MTKEESQAAENKAEKDGAAIAKAEAAFREAIAKATGDSRAIDIKISNYR